MSRDLFAYRGSRSPRRYFEGWYFKHVARDGTAWSFIPGSARDSSGDAHAFVQVIRGSDGATAYQRYQASEFSARSDTLEVEVGLNRFGWEGIRLNLPDVFGGISGILNYGEVVRPGTGRGVRPIMGWYRSVPFMECYHEVGSVDHELHGTLSVGGVEIDFDGGRGYLEKDWGRSMPSAWIWMQCNGFETPGASLMVSIARIPWIGRSFVGHLGFVRHPLLDGGAVQLFGTWSGAKVCDLEVVGDRVQFNLETPRYSLAIGGVRTHTGSLQAPDSGAMDRRIAESLDATLRCTIRTDGNDIIAEERGHPAGLELVGDLESLGARVEQTDPLEPER